MISLTPPYTHSFEPFPHILSLDLQTMCFLWNVGTFKLVIHNSNIALHIQLCAYSVLMGRWVVFRRHGRACFWEDKTLIYSEAEKQARRFIYLKTLKAPKWWPRMADGCFTLLGGRREAKARPDPPSSPAGPSTREAVLTSEGRANCRRLRERPSGEPGARSTARPGRTGSLPAPGRMGRCLGSWAGTERGRWAVRPARRPLSVPARPLRQGGGGHDSPACRGGFAAFVPQNKPIGLIPGIY